MKFVCSILFMVLVNIGLNGQRKNPDQLFKSYKVINFNSIDTYHSFSDGKDDIHRLVIDGWEMTLVNSEIISDNYVSMDQDGNILRQGLPDVIPMNGYTDEGYRVSLTIGPGFTYGFIKIENDFIYFEPASEYINGAQPNEVISYSSSDVKEGETGTCGFTEMQKAEERFIPNLNNQMTGLCYDVQYAICNDWSQVNDRGGTAQAEAFAIGVTNDVNTNYDDEFADELRHVITGQFNSTCSSCDPWTSNTDAGVLLTSFRNWAQSNLSIPHDVASLWTNRNLDGTTVGIAYIGQVCTSLKYNVLEHFGNGNTETFRVLTAHELGHNWGAGHDSSGGDIMAPSVSTATTWSAQSKAAIEGYYSGVSCLSVCIGSTPQLNFSTLASDVIESGLTGTGGPCNEPYTDIIRTIELSIAPTSDIEVGISIDGSGTADINEDFQLLNNSLTFTPTGNLSQNITIRIFDDKIEEMDETIILNLNITSGTAELGPFDSHTITIDGSTDDQVSGICCSGGGEVIYDDVNAAHYANPTMLYGDVNDERFRTIIPASGLLSNGLVAGQINKMDFFITSKTSTGPFQNFRVGIYETTTTFLSPSVPWHNTTEVFSGDVNTTGNAWLELNLDTPFNWDGTSNLYIEICFDNSSPVGIDNVLMFNPGTSSVDGVQFLLANFTPGCSLTPGTINVFNDRHPVIRFTQPAGAVIEKSIATSTGKITIGNTAHFYSPDNEVMLSIKNIGSTDMNCVDVDILTSGTGKSNLPFGSKQYSNKTFRIDADNNALYEATLYYSDTELATWGSGDNMLNIIKAPVPIASSNIGNADFVLASKVTDNIGAGSGKGYKAVLEGSGYLALTDVMMSMKRLRLTILIFV